MTQLLAAHMILKMIHKLMQKFYSCVNTWKCYKPEYHYGSIQDWIVDKLWYKETQGKNYLQEIRSVQVLFDDKWNI